MKIYQPPSKISKPKTKLITFLAVIIFLGLVFGAGYFVHASGFFKIKNISVAGTKDYSKDKLIADLKYFFQNKSKISSLLGADNILVWQADVSGFLSDKPEFKTLNVSPDILKRQVNISAQEREKFGIWCLSRASFDSSGGNASTSEETSFDGDCYWFDKDGILFVKAPAIEGELFNKVIDSAGRDLKSGDKVLDDRLFVNLIEVFKIADTTDLNSKTLQLKNIGREEIVIEPIKSPTLFFSLRFNPDFSLSAIKALKNDGRWNKLNYADFRVENKVYYKFK